MEFIDSRRINNIVNIQSFHNMSPPNLGKDNDGGNGALALIPTSYWQYRASNVGSLIRDQKQNRTGLFLQSAVALHECAIDGLINYLLIPLLFLLIDFTFITRYPACRRFCPPGGHGIHRSEEHTSELQSRGQLVCRLLLEKKK